MSFMTRALACLCLLLSLALPTAAQEAQGTKEIATKPNVVLIVADDLGWNAVGYHGGFTETPHIDSIAERGAALGHFYVSPMCSPTRAGLMTGRYPIRFGMARTVVRPWADFGLPPEEVTLPERLAEVGYPNRGAFGKWHLGHLRPEWHPLMQGFTEFKGHYNGAEDYWTHDRDGENDWHVGDEPLEEEGYQTDLVGAAAADFIRRHAEAAKSGEPFFAYVPFMAPHDPLQVPEDRIKPLGGNAGKKKETLAAMVAVLDDNVGRILNALEETGTLENTLIIFMSDNGGTGGIRGNNRPLRGSKLSAWEGGIRVPAAVWWPGQIEGGNTVDAPLINLDFLPTILAAAGSPVADADDLDGVNVLPTLRGEGTPAPRDLYAYHGQGGEETEWLSIRTGDGWKLLIHGPDVRRPERWGTPDHEVALFRIDEDPNEENDLKAEHPDVVERLGEKLVAFRELQPEDAEGAPNQPPAGFVVPKMWRNKLPTGS